jgi:drug/metabolite transporter (DMT)-like permease
MSFLEKLQAVFVIIFGRIVLGEVLPRRNMPIVVLTLVLACLLLVDNPLDLARMSVNVAGLAAGVGCAAFYGANVVMYKYMSGRGIRSSEIAFFRMSFGSLAVLPVLLYSDGEIGALFQLGKSDYVILFGLVVTSVVVAFKLFVRGIQYTSATTAGILELATPIISLLVSSLFFHEDVSMFQLMIIPCYLLCIVALTIPSCARGG